MCKYCEAYKENSIFWNTHRLYENIKGESYLYIDLNTLQNNKDRKAKLRVESCVDNKVNRGTIDINYCPMCGRKLGE